MNKQVRKVLGGLSVLAIFATVLSGTAFAGRAVSANDDRSAVTEERSSAAVGDQAADGDAKRSLAGVAMTNSKIYQTAKDFALAIHDAQKMDEDDNSFNYTIVGLVYLIDDLEGQPEGNQLQALLKGVVRGTKKAEQVGGELASISKAYVGRQTAEQKWYFNVGQSQMRVTIAGWAIDSQGIKGGLKELQNLAKTAPPAISKPVIDALNGVSKYSSKVTFTKDDCSELSTEVKKITKAVYA